MKKAAIVICAAVYAVAIIVVAFLGYQAEIKNPPIYAEDIVLVQEVPFERYENGILVYTIEEAPKTEGNTNSVKYNVSISDFEFFYYVLEGKIDLKCKPISFKVDEKTGERKEPDDKTVSYFCSNKEVSVDAGGIVSFLNYRDDGSVNVIVSSNDGSNINIYINIFW